MPNNQTIDVGDIVWAKVGRYPYWPSIVCAAPKSNKFNKKTRSQNLSIHVRFFNDFARRCWTHKVEIYSNKDDLLSKHPNCLYAIKENIEEMKIWESAVKEADSFLLFDRDERVGEFLRKYKLKGTNLLKPSTSSNNASGSKKTHGKVLRNK